jgi:hypothetical protein
MKTGMIPMKMGKAGKNESAFLEKLFTGLGDCCISGTRLWATSVSD